MTLPQKAQDQAKAEISLNAELFQPLPANTTAAERITRPTLTYWQDAFRRLFKDRVAVVSISFILFLFVAVLVGPFLMPKSLDGVDYHNRQDTLAIDTDPNLGTPLFVIDDLPETPEPEILPDFVAAPPATEASQLQPPKNFHFVAQPNESGVLLKWDPVPNATGYRIYRISVDIGKEKESAEKAVKDMGERSLPIANVDSPAQVTLFDSNGLTREFGFAYSITAIVTSAEGSDLESEEASTLSTQILPSIHLSDAKELSPKAEVGHTVMGRTHIFGTDSLGRDVLARMLEGGRASFLLGFLIPAITILIGIVFGSVSALAGGTVDLVMQRIVEVWENIPDLLLMIMIQLAMGPSIKSLIVAMVVTGWAGTVRLIRGEVLRLREIEYVHASRLLGASYLQIIFRHIVPNISGLLIIVYTARVPGVILNEAGLGLLGLGIRPPAPSWGNVLQTSSVKFVTHPWQMLLPSFVLVLTVLAFYLLGNALRDALDPRARGRE